MKKLLQVLICISLVFATIGCTAKEANKVEDTDIPKYTENTDISSDNEKNENTDTTEDYGYELLVIQSLRKDCIPVSLSFYKDGKYEFFYEYLAYKEGGIRPLNIRYTKSKKGTYSINIDKIIEESIDDDDKKYSNEDLIEYKLYTYRGEYIIPKDKPNQNLNAFLKKIKVDLSACASPDYVG